MSYIERPKAIVLLEDGTVFFGKSVGISGTSFGEICFNTGMTGYQEIFTDPSYFGQIMVTTSAHIGNYGTHDLDNQSDSIKIAGLICKNFSFSFSRYGQTSDLLSFFKHQNKLVVSNIDTRALVKYIRENGAMNALITTELDKIDGLKRELKKTPSMKGMELVSKVSTKKPYLFGNPESKFKVAAIDLGIKKSILKNLANQDIYVKVFPYNTTFNEIEKWKPNGYFLSNGPGDPEPLVLVQELTQKIIEKNYPLFGICLGHQVIALANGIPTFKMFNGHRGINNPVINHETGKGEITSQNHGFAVDRKALESNPNIIVTHSHLNDNTVAGLKMKQKKCFSVQYHPEAAPGPNDAHYLFTNFKKMLSIN
tara:strand:- start:15964 stop:17067 length:1104 start_codon:yes stop_codon:yes gene_type:complete